MIKEGGFVVKGGGVVGGVTNNLVELCSKVWPLSSQKESFSLLVVLAIKGSPCLDVQCTLVN